MTSQRLADRLRDVESSPTLALAAKAKALLKAGKPVLDFTAGEPDFPTPEHIKRAGMAAIERNDTKYTPASGLPELRSAVAATVSRRLGVAYEPSQVLISCGAKHALYNALQAVCQHGDEALILSPYWVSYVPLVQLTGAKPVLIPTEEADRYQPDLAAVQAAATPATKVLILNSPSNPTGMLIERPALAALAKLALAKGWLVISDEIYDQLVFPPGQAASIVQVEPRVAGQTIVVNGVSKTYCMTGWRIGYALGPKPILEAMGALQSHSTSNPTSISQHAALAALTGETPELPGMLTAFQQRRDRLVNGLNGISRMSCLMPQGAFYAWCNVSRLGRPAAQIAARWLEECHVAVVPGESFGSSAHVRFSFATSLQAIDGALERLARWVP